MPLAGLRSSLAWQALSLSVLSAALVWAPLAAACAALRPAAAGGGGGGTTPAGRKSAPCPALCAECGADGHWRFDCPARYLRHA